ncbi:MAG: hypothetical protein COV37_11930 [Bdellovibrio sp. CG11_big_fil_rev_8_21_14_0_20_39_38]|nr:MAG: hypothetical protein COW78_02765 [Bdellovibrio sp. CG22_combo_CG10-13_8_21_14_all_39_27]PIR34760.1 MAG: hypothetical protein COV37_11930 [Bdellovibrio sp. CG11_big_fil_rev_8_21_14_0_20_39_38]
MKFIIFGLMFSISISHAFLSSDTAVLLELVTTTASQLNELEKLVSNAEKYTEKMQKYNELVQDEYFRAERVLYLAESVAAKKEVQGLSDLNYAIRELKYSMSDMRELMKEYAVIKGEEDKTKRQVKTQKKTNDLKERIAVSQVNKSVGAKTSGRASQLTAQNTAMIYESNVDMHNTQLEILEKVSTTNRLLAEQMEEKRLEQMQKEQSYNMTRSKR